MTVTEMRRVRAAEAQKYLEKLMRKLDELDEDDFFGTEGWRHFLMGED
jgi:hypothetical protein